MADEARLTQDKSEDVKNTLFRKLFSLPRSEKLMSYYSCAYHKKILLQGRLYLSKNFLCFYSNVFGYETRVVIPMADIIGVRKRKTMAVIPNAILVETSTTTYFFTSFIMRDHAFENISETVRVYKEPREGLPASVSSSPMDEKPPDFSKRGSMARKLTGVSEDLDIIEKVKSNGMKETSIALAEDVTITENGTESKMNDKKERKKSPPRGPNVTPTAEPTEAKKFPESKSIGKFSITTIEEPKTRAPPTPHRNSQNKGTPRSRTPQPVSRKSSRTRAASVTPDRLPSQQTAYEKVRITRKSHPNVSSVMKPKFNGADAAPVRREYKERKRTVTVDRAKTERTKSPNKSNLDGKMERSVSDSLISSQSTAANSEDLTMDLDSKTAPGDLKSGTTKAVPSDGKHLSTVSRVSSPEYRPVFTDPLPPPFSARTPAKGAAGADFKFGGALRLPMNVKAFKKLFMDNKCRFNFKKFHKSVGDEAFQSSSWQTSAGPTKRVKNRQIYFVKTKLTGPIGPKQTRVHKAQRSQDVKEGAYVMESISIMPDVPYGGYFNVVIRWVVVDTPTRNSPMPSQYAYLCPSNASISPSAGQWLVGRNSSTWSLLQVWISVEFTKSTFLKYQIKSFTHAGVKKFVEDWMVFCKRSVMSLVDKRKGEAPVVEEQEQPTESLVDHAAATRLAKKMMVSQLDEEGLEQKSNIKLEKNISKKRRKSVEEAKRSRDGMWLSPVTRKLNIIVGDEGYLTLAQAVSLLLLLVLFLLVYVLFVPGVGRSASSVNEAQNVVSSAAKIGQVTAGASLANFISDLPVYMQLSLLENQAGQIGNGFDTLLIKEDIKLDREELLSLRNEMQKITRRIKELREVNGIESTASS
mmetsp:Transcript_9655/g.14465  ORF Transcript_9655/g.14465 Transcript_9655/m.14465 type:complete len:865 (+) Transcript_9655:22-2616(+)|eukprot:CAMPEP_0167755028 /NCGR_PEP_ID=MMETSP0110_2-20121227/8597_1 /TAXON_ID=629695 /ORGANISM="Gymnochlora sp., Strain CCMP2014" /LENGTH=864 /DNA_ID=CAMNT_0007640971 /DNA_START=17 /DNA_END=2611 /DNA_ORIENTATION=+